MPAAPLHVPAFVVIGGGTIGAGSARQLLRARAAGRLTTERIVVVDHDPRCLAASLPAPVELATDEWSRWLAQNLACFGERDHFVPDHWAPHLLRDWLTGELAAHGAVVDRVAITQTRGLPYEGTTRAGDRALSYASWICPPRCIEPALCPHTRGPKDWSLAGDLHVDATGRTSIVFECLHLVYGIGTVPIASITAARDLVLRNLAGGSHEYLVATSSHCHALASALRVAKRPVTT